jgi:hypothetical protein
MRASGGAVTGGRHTRIDVAAGCRQAFLSKSLARFSVRIREPQAKSCQMNGLRVLRPTALAVPDCWSRRTQECSTKGPQIWEDGFHGRIDGALRTKRQIGQPRRG